MKRLDRPKLLKKLKLSKRVKLNLGCGDNKINGYINIDAVKEVRPDLVLDISKHDLPYKKSSVDEVLMFHTIEHIEKRLHGRVLLEISRVLKPGGKLYLSYPNFWECAKMWHENTSGIKNFWESTLYGRQSYKGDYHVCAMNPDELTAVLYECGFKEVMSYPEPQQDFNTVTIAVKDPNGVIITYETAIVHDMQNMLVKEVKCH